MTLSRWSAWLEWLIAVPAGDAEQSERGRFLAGVLLLYAPLLLGVGIGVFARRYNPGAPHLSLVFFATVSMAAAVAVAYVLNRRGARTTAARIFTFAGCVTMSVAPLEHPELLYFAVVCIMITTSLLPLGLGTGLASSMLVIAHGLPLVVGTARVSELVPPLCVNVFMLPLCIALQSHQRRLERIRFEELARRKNWSATVLSSIGDGVLTCDADGRVMFLNPVAEALTGWRMEEARGRPLAEVFQTVGEENDAPVESLAARALRQGSRVSMADHTLLITRDGSRRPVAESGAPLHNHEGSTVGAVLAFRDVSMEHALQGRLQRSQQLEALGRLAGGVAHDFNNLLTVIGGSASLALEDMEETHPARDELSYVLEATKRAVGMTSQLLAFSRRQVMQPQAVDLNASITQTCQMMRRLLREHVHIALELGSDVGHVMVDPVQLEQVIMNLALNAGDAMPQGGVLRLSTARVVVDDEHPVPSLKPQAYVRFRVADTGVGMNEDTQRHAFEPFFTTKQRSRGTGLGLATVYGIVQQSGGTVTLHSVPQEGTTFDIYLPWAEAPQQVGQAFPASEPIGVADAGRTILVVEDDPMVRWLVVSTLTKAGHRVLEAESGEEAIARLEAGSLGRLDLLVTDVVMQATSGVQVAERLVTTYAKVPVLFMSGYANEVLASQGLRKAGNAFLAKPFTPAQLLKAANRLLKERRNTAARSSGAA